MSNLVEIFEKQNNAEEIVPRFPNKSFKQHFRIDPEVFEILCKEINDLEENTYHEPGRSSTSIEKQLMITLWYLGNQESMKSIATRFDVCIAKVWRIVSYNCDTLIRLNKSKKCIKWPTLEESFSTSNYYFTKKRFPGIIGSIDVSHISIRAPIISNNAYINRKGFHSVQLQVVCNHKMEFLHCYTGEAGSVPNALLLIRSGLSDKITSGEFNMNKEQHLLGDLSYPIKEWLLTPYEDNQQLREDQSMFNRIHLHCRMTNDQAFGLLKGRFRRLFHIDSLKLKSIEKYIIASCILHNICLQNNDMGEEFVAIDDDEKDEYMEDNHQRDIDSIDTQFAEMKRDRLLNSLFM